MPTLLQRLLPGDLRAEQAALAGLAATATYSVAMKADKYITGNHFDDVKCIQGLFNDPEASSRGKEAIAWGIHFLNGLLLGEVYAVFGKRFLPGPGWLKGSLFGMAFICLVWPLTPLVDRYHPMVKNGQLPPLTSWTSFAQNILRHLIFGLSLGLLYRSRHK